MDPENPLPVPANALVLGFGHEGLAEIQEESGRFSLMANN
jgi:hypothetical protein